MNLGNILKSVYNYIFENLDIKYIIQFDTYYIIVQPVDKSDNYILTLLIRIIINMNEFTLIKRDSSIIKMVIKIRSGVKVEWGKNLLSNQKNREYFGD